MANDGKCRYRDVLSFRGQRFLASSWPLEQKRPSQRLKILGLFKPNLTALFARQSGNRWKLLLKISVP